MAAAGVAGAFGVDVAVGGAVGSPSPVFETLARGVTILGRSALFESLVRLVYRLADISHCTVLGP